MDVHDPRALKEVDRGFDIASCAGECVTSPVMIAFSVPELTSTDWSPGVCPGVQITLRPALKARSPSSRSSTPAASRMSSIQPLVQVPITT